MARRTIETRQPRKPRRRLTRVVTLGFLVVVLAISGAAAAARYAYQQPAGVVLARLIEPELEWQRGKYPSLAWAFAVVDAVLPSDPVTEYRILREPEQPLPVSPAVGPQQAWATLPACYNADGNARPVAGVEPRNLADLRCVLPGRPSSIVENVAGLREALRHARPGDHILLRPGRYGRSSAAFELRASGTPSAPIFLRADRPGDVVIEGRMRITGGYWVIQNIEIIGTCKLDVWCEHAVQVAGGGRGTILRNVAFRNFNSAIKVNGSRGKLPDGGLVEGALLANDAPRPGDRPTTMFDLVGASEWTVRRTIFADSAKQGGDGVSYAGFFKGGGSGGVFEQNLVLCQWRHRGGTRIGLSLGGGGTGARYCRNRRCESEHENGTIRNNIIAGCSDVGVYLNKAPGARVENNLLYKTRGIDARYAHTNAQIRNNIIDGRILARDGARVDASSNMLSLWRAIALVPISQAVLTAPSGGSLALINSDSSGAPLDASTYSFCGSRREPARPGIGPLLTSDAGCAHGIRLP